MSLHDSLVNYAVITRWINSVKIFSSNSSLSLKSPAIGLARTVPRKDLTTPSRKRTNRAFSFICLRPNTRLDTSRISYCTTYHHASHRFPVPWRFTRTTVSLEIFYSMIIELAEEIFLSYDDWRIITIVNVSYSMAIDAYDRVIKTFYSMAIDAYHHIVEISCSMIIK